MYILYETYTDETRTMKNMRFNTKLIGIYKDKKNAINKLNEHLEDIQLDFKGEYNWYIKEFEKELMEDSLENGIAVYEVFNDELDNCSEVYYVILEKIGDDIDE